MTDAHLRRTWSRDSLRTSAIAGFDTNRGDASSSVGKQTTAAAAVQARQTAADDQSFGPSFFDALRPSFSDEHGFGGEGDSLRTVDPSFGHRPSLLDDDDAEVPSTEIRSSDNSCGRRPPLLDAVVSPPMLSIVQAPAEVLAATCDVDQNLYRPTNSLVSKTTGRTPQCAVARGRGATPAHGAADTNNLGHANAVAAITSLRANKPVLSRQSSAASSSSSLHGFGSQQRRMAASHESWRISSLDVSESKHAFDEELGPQVGHPQSPRASAVHAPRSEQQSRRLSAVASTSSNSSSFTSFHSQSSIFVNQIQQSFPSVSSPSLGIRPSGEDSFTNVAILGDDVRDQNERRSSDVVPQHVGEFRSNVVAGVLPTDSDALDHSYSNLVDVGGSLDRIFSKPVDHQGLYSVDGNDSSANVSANGMSSGSSSALSAESQSSAASDELSFLSFSATTTELTKQQRLREAMEQRSLLGTPVRQKASYEAGQVMYRSIVVPRGNGVKTGNSSKSLYVAPSACSTGATNFSSAAIKMRDVYTDARSEKTEAGDMALGTLPQLAPPLKIILAPRSSLSSSPLSNNGAESSRVLASPLAMLSRTRSFVASSTSSADCLDFTGVYRGSINSLKSSDDNDSPSRHIRSEAATMQMRSQGERQDILKFECLGVKLGRSKSDGCSMQRESRRKVEDFYRDTHQNSVLDIDGRKVHRVTNRKTRASTTVVQYVDNIVEGHRSFAFQRTKATKIIDFKNLCNGGKRLGWHLQYDAIPLTPQQEEEVAKHRAMNLTIGTTSTGTTATRSMPSDHIPMPGNYMVSPQATDALVPKMHAKEKAHASQFKTAGGERSGFFSVLSGPGGHDVSRSRAMSGQWADRLALPLLSASDSPSLSPSPFATSFATFHGFGGSGGTGSGRSPGKSPVVFAVTSNGFLWKSRSSFNGLNDASSDLLFDASPAISRRSKLVDCVQSLSASVVSALPRCLYTKDFYGQNGHVNLTPPQSSTTVPAALPRAYNHNGFYEIPFKVPDLNKPLLQREKQQLVESDCNWIRQWMILAACVVFGLCAGAILVQAVALDTSIFNLSAAEVHDRQESNGELVFAAGVQWFFLPGHLFVRVWSAAVTPLLVCYVVNAISDLVGCADKATLILSFRSIGYAVMLAMLATVEGVLAMWMTHKFGWFRGSSSTARSEASILSDAIGVTPLPEGAVGLVCTDDGKYLRRLDHDVFSCSNAPLLLPLYEEVSTNSTDISGSGPAVFALQEVTRVFATPTSTMAYYPVSLGTGGNAATSLLLSLSPDNLTARYAEVVSDRMAPLGGLVFALLVGHVCGKRILRLRRDAQAAMFESMESNDTATEDPHKACHYIVGLLVELQLALEWLVRPMERYLAPVGFFSLMLGHVVAHHREWRSFTGPMWSLLVGVLVLVVLHAVVVLPMVLTQFSSSRHRLALLTTTRAFVPAFLFAFTTDNVALSAPVTMQCYARVLTLTRSAAQVATAVTAAVSRNARALYLPLVLLWLLETSSSEVLKLSASDYLCTGMLSMLSCFCGGSSRLTMAMARTLWSIHSSSPASALSATMPLLVVCDAVLSRFASVVDHFVLTHLAAQHWGEAVVHGPPNGLGSSSSASPLDDSQGRRSLSSAMLSSVSL